MEQMVGPTESRALRGLALWRECRSQLDVAQDGCWLVPSESEPGKVHRVSVGSGTCDCEDHRYSGLRCKHYFVAVYEEALEVAHSRHERSRRKAERTLRAVEKQK